MSDNNEVFVSVASLWALSIKAGIGKIKVNHQEISWAITQSDFCELNISGEHSETLLKLPPYHKSPFDRLLVAQAMTEPKRLINADKKLQQYSDLVWLI